MAPIKLDAIDAAIIDLLQQDGRMAATEMARQLDITSRIARYRIERLVQAGVITVTAVVHPRPLGFTVMADILVETEPGTTIDVVHQLGGMECVTYASAATGDRDINIQVVAKTVDELYDFTLNIVQQIPGVRQTRTYFVPQALKFTYNWKLPRGCHDDTVEEDQS